MNLLVAVKKRTSKSQKKFLYLYNGSGIRCCNCGKSTAITWMALVMTQPVKCQRTGSSVGQQLIPDPSEWVLVSQRDESGSVAQSKL